MIILLYLCVVKLVINLETNKKMEEKKSVRGQLHELAIGEKVSFPADKTSYVRSSCTNFAFEWNRKFTTATDKVARIITVTRIR